MNPDLLRRLARLTDRADRLVAREQLTAAQRELRLARERDPATNRAAMRAIRDRVRAERDDAERAARAREVAGMPGLDCAEATRRDRR